MPKHKPLLPRQRSEAVTARVEQIIANRDPALAFWAEEAENVMGPHVVALRASQPVADADGTPSLYYYDRLRSLAFHWTGDPKHLVEVAFDGDHEEPRWFFAYEMFAKSWVETPNIHFNIVTEFGNTCRNWIDAKEDAR